MEIPACTVQFMNFQSKYDSSTYKYLHTFCIDRYCTAYDNMRHRQIVCCILQFANAESVTYAITKHTL